MCNTRYNTYINIQKILMNENLKELATKSGFVGESMFPVFGTSQETALTYFAKELIDSANLSEYQRKTIYERYGMSPNRHLVNLSSN